MRAVKAHRLQREPLDRLSLGRRYGGREGKEYANNTTRPRVGRDRRQFTMKNFRRNDGN